MWAIPTGASWLLKKKKKNQVRSPSPESRVPKTGSDPPIGSDRESGCDNCNESLALKGWFSSIPTQMLNNIHVPFSDVEIKQALFDMSPFKAPRPYGFHAGFFQRMWDIVGDSIIKFARNLFDKGCLPERVNDTLLVLVPNVEYP